MVTLAYADGFEHQTLDTARFGGGVTTGLYDNVANAAGMSFIAGRWPGSLALRVNAAVTTRVRRPVANSTGVRIVSAYFRLSGHPSTSSPIFDMGIGGTGMDIRAATDGTIFPTVGGVTKTGTSVDYCDNQWHLLDLFVDTRANPWLVDWAIDSIPQTQASQAIAADTSSVSNFFCGQVTNPGQFIDYDDVAHSSTLGDYPLGPHRVISFVPTHDRIHNAGANVIEDQAGNDIGVVTAWDLVDEWPANTSDYIQQVAIGSVNRASVGFEAIIDPIIWGVCGIAAMFSSGTTANVATTRFIDVDDNNVLPAIYSAGDMSEITLNYRTNLADAPAGGWTIAAVNGLGMRVGFATSVGSFPRWSALMMVVAVAEGGRYRFPNAIEQDDVARFPKIPLGRTV